MDAPVYYIITGGDYICDYVYCLKTQKMIKDGFLDDYKFQMPYNSAVNLLQELNENFHLGIFLRLLRIEDAPPPGRSILITRKCGVFHLNNLSWEDEIKSVD